MHWKRRVGDLQRCKAAHVCSWKGFEVTSIPRQIKDYYLFTSPNLQVWTLSLAGKHSFPGI